MDEDEFQSWKDSAATQWVLRRLAEKAAGIEAKAKEELYFGTGLSPQEWAALQSRVGCDRGTVIGLNFVCGLELEEIAEPKRD